MSKNTPQNTRNTRKENMQYPKIRPISAFPVETSEGEFICLQDPNHYLEDSVFVSPEMFFVIRHFDGKHSFVEIQEAYMRHYGVLLYTKEIQQIVQELDQHLLLESPTFFAHLKRLRKEFARMSVRPPTHKGAAYPEDLAVLHRQFDTYFINAKGPGKIPVHQPYASDRTKTSSLKAIMAPHIDIKTGGPTFAWAYHALETSEADLFIILGTSHVDMKNFLALTRKAFETPFGRIETDHGFVNGLADQVSYDPFEDELIHKSEHSIEFQVIFLQYLREKMRRTKTSMKIVPILCGGSMYEAIAYNRPVEQVPQLEESIRALQRVLRNYEKACVIASVDFSHVGLRYGHRKEPTPEKLAKVERIDRSLLAAMEEVDHESFVTQLQRNRNATQVCGFVPIYTMLRLLEGTQGELLHYDQAEFGQGSYVSFASMAWKTQD